MDIASILPFYSDTTEYQTTSGHTINPSVCKKDLGVHMTPDYAWNEHIGEIITDANKAAAWALEIFKDF